MNLGTSLRINNQLAMPPLIDAYLRQAEPLLHTYQKDLYKLANNSLVIYRNDPESEIPVRVVDQATAQSAIEVIELPADEKRPPTFVEVLNLVEVVLLYNARFKAVVLQALLAEKELQDCNSSLKRKVSTLTYLKNSLEAFSEVVEKVHAFYAAKALGLLPQVSLPPLEEIKKAKNIIHNVKSKLTMSELHIWINDYCVDGFRVSDDTVICTILGMSEDASAGLSEFEPWMRAHQPLLYYIKKAMDVAIEEKRVDNTTHGKDHLQTDLQSLGFTLYTAATICLNIPDDTVDLQTSTFWAKRYLDYAYTYHPLLKTCPRYPYCATVIDEFFTIDLARQEFGEHSGTNVKVPILNVFDDSVGQNLVADKLTLLGQEDEYQLLFHGTTHDSAVSTITKGIILTAGEKKQDFSSSDGFYLSEDFENASVWSRAGRGGHQAVIVYKIKRNLLDAKEQNGLDLAQNKKQWEEVVLCCRNGYEDKRYKKRLDGITFVRGPLCINPQRLGCERPSGFGRDVMQLCIRNEDYAETFGNLENIGCVVFY